MGPAERAAAFVQDRIDDGTFPGAVWLVAQEDRIVAEGALGHAMVAPGRVETSAATLYDLASLTKPLSAALLAVLLERDGRLNLDEPLGRCLPAWRARDDRGRITPVDLLTHRSGLPAWMPLYLDAGPGDREARIENLRTVPLLNPPGAGVVYSDPAYILLGFALEAVGGAPLDRMFRERVTGPLGIDDLLYRPGNGLRDRTAATEVDHGRERHLAGARADGYNGWRSGVIRGEVHDQNAWTLGGVAGHAGLFGTARAVYRLAREFAGMEGGLLTDAERARFRVSLTPGLQEERALGFQIATTRGCSAGPALSPASFGHAGFTGTSLWIDPEAGRIFILLTNRVHPRFREIDMNAVRRGFHEAACP